ncbi:cell surface glycoprotein CD200 receptor 1-B-like [Cyrtonyx montezumae]|uniref:cell surface glycoprotein CD200 receptor 1-B-like n=1 Tax=Cyrtonyx montezumae TaxID=9017 RepID=UPI0032DA3AD3
MGTSQLAGWCKKPVSPINTRAALELVRNTTWTIVLLTIAAVTGATGNNSVLAKLGHSTVMTCPSDKNITMVTWKISPKTGNLCILAYRIDLNKTERTNCSDRMNWRSRPDRDWALNIDQVRMADEGNYTCEVVNEDGNFHCSYHLTVLVTHCFSLEHIAWFCQCVISLACLLASFFLLGVLHLCILLDARDVQEVIRTKLFWSHMEKFTRAFGAISCAVISESVTDSAHVCAVLSEVCNITAALRIHSLVLETHILLPHFFQ